MIRLLAGDCRDVLPTLAAGSVQCVVTSPPYYGLRDYGTALWDGGDAGCDHSVSMSRHSGLAAAAERCDGNARKASGPIFAKAPQQAWSVCGKCGATRIDRQIGLEATPDEYLATMVAVFREVRRVLRDDGTCWVNMGDSYAGSWGNQGRKAERGTQRPINGPMMQVVDDDRYPSLGSNTGACPPGTKPKDLLLMPARLALALQADGWWVRSDIIWAKPNPMPESCRDRPTSAHEHVFLLSKRSRYYYDSEGVREDAEYGRSVETASWHSKADANSAGIRFKNTTTPGNGGSRNLRNVWTLATQSFPDSHFATFPTALAERCIRAGTSERGCCAQCGAPWVRVTERTSTGKSYAVGKSDAKRGAGLATAFSGYDDGSSAPTFVTTGWQPGCAHDADVVPAVVLDPFAGAGTSLLVADRLQRDAIGIELNTAYTEMAMERCRADAPLLADLGPAPEHPVETEIADLFQDMAAD